MTAYGDMSAAGPRILDLLTVPEAAARLAEILGVRCSPKRVRRLVEAGELTQVKMGALARITPESVAAYKQRQAGQAEAGRAS